MPGASVRAPRRARKRGGAAPRFAAGPGRGIVAGMRLLPALGLSIALAALAAAPSTARAQTAEELAEARKTFNEGKELEKKSSWSAALEKFQKVAAVKMTPQVRFHIALCEENLGKLVSALRGFELAAEEAKQLGSSAAEVAQNAPPRAELLRKRIGTLQVNVGGRVRTSRVLLDGAPLAASAFGTAIQLDPGAHVVEVKDAAGKVTFHQEALLEEKSAEKIDVTVDDPEPVVEKPKAPPPPPPPPSRAPIYAAGAVGAAFLVGSAVFYGLRASSIASVAATCDQVKGQYVNCKPDLEGTAAAGRTYTTLSGVFLGVGLAGVATAGVVWIVQSRRAAAAKTAIRVGPSSLEIVGSF
jgi:hypothetical protein